MLNKIKEETSKKITLRTLKSFVKNNRSRLQILVSSTFDSSVDGVRQTDARAFEPVAATAYDERTTLGIDGIWLVGGSRNWFEAFNSETHSGFTVINCCGKFTVAIPVRALSRGVFARR
jgi:hypothetical protein